MPITQGGDGDTSGSPPPPPGLQGATGGSLAFPTCAFPYFAVPVIAFPEVGADQTGSAPANVASSVRPGHVHLEWDVDTDDTITHYLIYRQQDGGTLSLLDVAENIRLYGSYTDAMAAVPPITLKNFFNDYNVLGSSTYAYKVSAVRGNIESQLSSLTTARTPAVLPGEAVVPSLPASVKVTAPRSRLWLSWLVGGSDDTESGRLNNAGIDLAGRFGSSGWAHFKANEIDPILRDFPDINHIIYQPWGKAYYYTNASGHLTHATSFPLGTEVPLAEGGAGESPPYYRHVTDSNNFLDLCYKRLSSTPLAIMLHGFEDFLRAFGDAGAHVSVFQSILLANGTKDDGTILGPGGIRHTLAGNAGLMMDTVAAVDKVISPHGVRHPGYRAAELANAYGTSVCVEPLDLRANQRHWLNGTPDVGMISLGSRLLVTREDVSDVWTKETEVRGLGHIAIIGTGSIYWNPTPVTVSDVYAIAIRELAAGNQVSLQDGGLFAIMSIDQKQSLVQAAVAAPALTSKRGRDYPALTKYDLQQHQGSRIRDYNETRV